MKKKEILKRLSAVCMSAVMSVSLLSSSVYASEELFADGVSTEAEFTDEQTSATESTNKGNTDGGVEPDATDDSADLDIADNEDSAFDVEITEEDTEAESDELTDGDLDESGTGIDIETAFSDGTDDTAEFSSGDAVGDAEPAADATVHMTIGIRGSLAKAKDGSVMAEREVTVKDLNSDGILTYDEALAAVHEQYYEGGSAGYSMVADTSEDSWKVQKLWGISEEPTGYWKNGASCGELQTAVSKGDDLTAFVYKDAENLSDAYTRFENESYEFPIGTDKSLSVQKAVYEERLEEYNYVTGREVELTLYDSSFFPVDKGAYSVIDSPNYGNSYRLNVQNPGIYYLTATAKADKNLIPSVAKVTVRIRPSLSDLKLYSSQEDYENGGTPIAFSEAFDAQTYQYTIEAPDYKDDFYIVATLSKETVDAGYDTFGSYYGMGSLANYYASDGILTSEVKFGSQGKFKLGFMDTSVSYSIDIRKHVTLKSLTVDGQMDTSFDRDRHEYHVYVTQDTEHVMFCPEAYQKSYQIRINGTEVKSVASLEVPCEWGTDDTMHISIEVSSEDGISSMYTVELDRSRASDIPMILEQPSGMEYVIGDTADVLAVRVRASGMLSYQWYENTEDSSEGGKKLEGAEASTYTPSTEKAADSYYYCVVTNTVGTETYTAASSTAHIQVFDGPSVEAVFTDAGKEMPEDGYEYAWKKGFFYQLDEKAEPLEVKVSTPLKGGKITYRWTAVKSLWKPSWANVYSDNGPTCVPETYFCDFHDSITDTGWFYQCKVTYEYKGREYSTWAKTGEKVTIPEGEDAGKVVNMTGVYVFTRVSESVAPNITDQPKSAAYPVGSTINKLRTVAEIKNNGFFFSNLTYQWYVNDRRSTEGGTKIEGATGQYLDIEALGLQDKNTPGVRYYYCVASYALQGYVGTAVSNIAKVLIYTTESQIGNLFSGSGTQSDPYLIRDAADYQKLYGVVAQGISCKGKYFRQENDITLPADWKPIGITRDGTPLLNEGKNLYAFSGILDGNGKTLTIPEGGLPLLGYVKEAEVRNLNIYGTKIAGYGLVNNFEGAGLSGSAIIIDNVMLKSGSRTLKSGLIGANKTVSKWAGCSAGFYATIRNCTIEKDVIIGYDRDQSRIGSIAGRMSGTIENCVSYATVYGTDYVGGILGTIDNAMGDCTASGCEFYGTVKASGQHAGGIAGGGYSDDESAPNGRKITIKSCLAAGTVSGEDKVGGILGADTYVAQAWENCAYSMKGNSFTGTVKVTGEGASYIGGIIGFYDSLNRIDDIANNYYRAGCGAEKGIGFVRYVDTNCTTHETSSGAVYINTEDSTADCPVVSGCGWKIGFNRTDDPLGADAGKLTTTNEIKPYEEAVEISGTYRTEYEPSEDLDLTGMVIKVRMNVGSEKTVSLSDVKIEGYNKDRRGEQKVRIVCGAAYAEITVKVLKKDPEDIHVSFSLLGDQKHDSDEDKQYHSLHAGNLETWIPNEEYEVGGNATVLDVFEEVLTKYGYSWDNTKGNYIAGITTPDGTSLAEFTNGNNSGWMYTLNGIHPDLSVTEQYLEDGDSIVFHYTDDYKQEHDHVWGSSWSSDAAAHWHECEAMYGECDITDNTKKGGYGAHIFGTGKVTKTATCKAAGEKTYTCTVCGYQKKEKYTAGHNYIWKTVSKATVFAPEKQQGRCSVCGRTTMRSNGKKMTATIRLNATSITLQKKQTTNKIKVTMANGDSVKSWSSSNKKIATVSSKGVIKAGTKTGIAKITVTLRSGRKATLKVKVQTSKVKTTKISGLKKNVILKKGQKLPLRPVISPLTSQEKITYTSSNKKVATVTSRGIITAKKKGTAKITVRSGRKSYVIKITVK